MCWCLMLIYNVLILDGRVTEGCPCDPPSAVTLTKGLQHLFRYVEVPPEEDLNRRYNPFPVLCWNYGMCRADSGSWFTSLSQVLGWR